VDGVSSSFIHIFQNQGSLYSFNKAYSYGLIVKKVGLGRDLGHESFQELRVLLCPCRSKKQHGCNHGKKRRGFMALI
jgi:hypothetical protein